MSKLKFDCKTSEARLPIFITNTIRLQPSSSPANQPLKRRKVDNGE